MSDDLDGELSKARELTQRAADLLIAAEWARRVEWAEGRLVDIDWTVKGAAFAALLKRARRELEMDGDPAMPAIIHAICDAFGADVVAPDPGDDVA